MRMRLLLFAFLLSLTFNRSIAQAFDSSLMIPKSALRNTSFTAYFLTDSFSKRRDSIQASTYLLRIDPYYLMYQGITPADLDSFFLDYKLTNKAKEEFRKKFAGVYNTPETETYKKFREMRREDQDARYKAGKCNDSFSCAVFMQKMMYSDSIHFDYLHKYVQKNGWPKLSDGSLYVEIVALHDMPHMKYYLPFMKKAVLSGDASYNGYGNMLNRAIKPTFEELSSEYKNKVVFDISYILKQDTPKVAKLDLMKKAVKEHKPVKYIYFVYEGNSQKDFKEFMTGKYRGGSDAGMECYWNAWALMVHLARYQNALLFTNDNIPYDFVYSESFSPKKKLTLYLLY
jgi:thiol-disulfide isomerase/thioredoxin